MTAQPKSNVVALPKPKDIDENYQPPDADQLSARDREIVKVIQNMASSIREGRQRERREILAEAGAKAISDLTAIPSLKAAHEAEITRNAKAIGRAAHRDGMLQGVIMGMALAVVLAFATWYVLRDIVLFNTATQRVSYPEPPTLTDQSAPETYERGRREPADR